LTEHYTLRTQEASKWCNECKTFTLHRVEGGRITRVCIPCQEKDEAERQLRLQQPAQPAAMQFSLFAGGGPQTL